MTSRERIRAIVAGEPADRVGLWLGWPHPDFWPPFHALYGTSTPDEVRLLLGDDFRWICPWDDYKHPDGVPLFPFTRPGGALAEGGAYASLESIDRLDEVPWPNPDYLNFTAHLDLLRNAGPYYRAGGFWCSFFHTVAAFFGMEEYFIKMHTHPALVHEVTRRVVDFYLEANRRLYALAGDEIDGFFFGNDYGTQRSPILSPAAFDEFLVPYIRQLTQQARDHGYQVLTHSCGAVCPLIDRFIDAGVQALHPLQALAADMDADNLARRFAGRIAFIGGIDTQQLLVHGTPEEVKADVRRVKALLGPRLIVSPSHECVLPNVPPANLRAMAEAALE